MDFIDSFDLSPVIVDWVSNNNLHLPCLIQYCNQIPIYTQITHQILFLTYPIGNGETCSCFTDK